MYSLAKCLNCDQLFIDTNPSTDQREYDVNLEWISSLKDHKCPDCGVDDYLVDVIENIVMDYHHSEESVEVHQYQIDERIDWDNIEDTSVY